MPQIMWCASHQITTRSNPLSQQLRGASMPSLLLFEALIFLFLCLRSWWPHLWKCWRLSVPFENNQHKTAPNISLSHLGSIFWAVVFPGKEGLTSSKFLSITINLYSSPTWILSNTVKQSRSSKALIHTWICRYFCCTKKHDWYRWFCTGGVHSHWSVC